jgi:NAD+ kinase
MHIYLVPNSDNPLACSTAATLVAALKADGHTLSASAEDVLACGLDIGTSLASDTHLVVALGGDGTVLRAAHQVAGADVPIVGVNLGRLGFLCGTGETDPVTAVRAVAAGEGREERRATLEIEVTLGGRESGSHEALNEVFVGRGAGARAVDLEVSVDGERLARWVCDGLVIATPTGSTAYALSAGGPLLSPELRAMVLVPVAPHSLSSRPLVLGPDARVTVTLPDPARADACVLVDGDLLPCRSTLERVEVSMGMHEVRLVRLGGDGFATSVRETFFTTR